MNWKKKSTIADASNQTILFSVKKGKESIHLGLRLNYRYRTDRWYATIIDGVTMKDIITNIPVVSSYGRVNNMIRQFQYKEIGSMAAVAVLRELQKFDPYGSDISSWEIYWGDESSE